MDESHCRHLIEHYLLAYNRFDIDAMLAVLAHNVRFENHSDGQLTLVTEGIDAFGELARQSAQMFREREQRLLELTFKDGVVLASIGWRGVFAQDIPGGPSAGSELALQGRSEFAFEDGRIVRIIDHS
ncbi:nuclear transport factor 2 family protein [Stenotrophomonas maltophilia]|uniref:nuclear transport factor 2 family protein n=1 Tax=Stenotrophomonas TaxID=40323 RepID=UPI0013126021|nr:MULTISPECIES: nuclear transport factor 2 family protein [Stenotrophomonas]ELC7322104.1 nuclear transport factor 2 family protein [Stenotrophomonas maltophilia]MBA0276141.1 nuclear transport factor 2 family protein [Stenotrophomonas maltophilia]MBA0411340.1 nuclear transport factor 2 family protein [Stenotrophomonas maltophilia]MBA0496443.1 nuclear transport factor 2 family protein [Stenotrophomonas maltophilia]MBA0500563.1 nuclear transport factor 2 family protein [Stenotrophomonas maltophi